MGYIYKSLQQSAEDKKLADEQKRARLEEEDSEEEIRNQEIIQALTGRVKKEAPYRDEKGRFAKKPTKETKPTNAKPTETPKPIGTKPTRTPKPTGTNPIEAPKVFKPNPARTPRTPSTPTTKTPIIPCLLYTSPSPRD